MAKEILADNNLDHLVEAASHLVKLPKTHFHADYDEEADVLYIYFTDLPESNHSEMRDDGIILDYQDDQLVGITILEASRHRR